MKAGKVGEGKGLPQKMTTYIKTPLKLQNRQWETFFRQRLLLMFPLTIRFYRNMQKFWLADRRGLGINYNEESEKIAAIFNECLACIFSFANFYPFISIEINHAAFPKEKFPNHFYCSRLRTLFQKQGHRNMHK